MSFFDKLDNLEIEIAENAPQIKQDDLVKKTENIKRVYIIELYYWKDGKWNIMNVMGVEMSWAKQTVLRWADVLCAEVCRKLDFESFKSEGLDWLYHLDHKTAKRFLGKLIEKIKG